MSTQLTVQAVSNTLEQLAPGRLAESWDNVGLLVGDPLHAVGKIMTCLTITPASAAEAIARNADLIVAHHPLPFRPLQRLTTETTTGKLLLDLISANISVYSAHTAFDSSALGINQQLAEGLGLSEIKPLVGCADPDNEPAGSGRYGKLESPISLGELAERVRDFLKIVGLHRVLDPGTPISRVAVACGSGGDFLAAAQLQGCDCLVTGEARFHTCLEAEACGMGLLLPGHFASERFAMERLAVKLAETLPQAEVWASDQEADPLRWSS